MARAGKRRQTIREPQVWKPSARQHAPLVSAEPTLPASSASMRMSSGSRTSASPSSLPAATGGVSRGAHAVRPSKGAHAVQTRGCAPLPRMRCGLVAVPTPCPLPPPTWRAGGHPQRLQRVASGNDEDAGQSAAAQHNEGNGPGRHAFAAARALRAVGARPAIKALAAAHAAHAVAGARVAAAWGGAWVGGVAWRHCRAGDAAAAAEESRLGVQLSIRRAAHSQIVTLVDGVHRAAQAHAAALGGAHWHHVAQGGQPAGQSPGLVGGTNQEVRALATCQSGSS